MARELGGLLLGQLDREALERVCVDVAELALVGLGELVRDERDVAPVCSRVEHNDVGAAYLLLVGGARRSGDDDKHADRGDDAAVHLNLLR
jgi:hypothetical protein